MYQILDINYYINVTVCVTSDKSDHLISSELLTNNNYFNERK
jgi:hypothetical protein